MIIYYIWFIPHTLVKSWSNWLSATFNAVANVKKMQPIGAQNSWQMTNHSQGSKQLNNSYFLPAVAMCGKVWQSDTRVATMKKSYWPGKVQVICQLVGRVSWFSWPAKGPMAMHRNVALTLLSRGNKFSTPKSAWGMISTHYF